MKNEFFFFKNNSEKECESCFLFRKQLFRMSGKNMSLNFLYFEIFGKMFRNCDSLFC